MAYRPEGRNWRFARTLTFFLIRKGTAVNKEAPTCRKRVRLDRKNIKKVAEKIIKKISLKTFKISAP